MADDDADDRYRRLHNETRAQGRRIDTIGKRQIRHDERLRDLRDDLDDMVEWRADYLKSQQTRDLAQDSATATVKTSWAKVLGFILGGAAGGGTLLEGLRRWFGGE